MAVIRTRETVPTLSLDALIVLAHASAKMSAVQDGLEALANHFSGFIPQAQSASINLGQSQQLIGLLNIVSSIMTLHSELEQAKLCVTSVMVGDVQ